MATATYSDFVARHPDSKAPESTVAAYIDDAAAEISARCSEMGTDYETVVANRRGVVVEVECSFAYRACGRIPAGDMPQNELRSFSQTVGDHKLEYGFNSGNGNQSVLEAEWRKLGLAGQRIGWLALP